MAPFLWMEQYYQNNQKTLFRTHSKHATLNTFSDQFILNNVILQHEEEKYLTFSLCFPGN